MKRKPLIYLASQSPRRKEILQQLKVSFKVVSSSYQERMMRGVSPRQLVKLHSVNKSKKAKVPRSAEWVLGADTVVYCRGKILGKPKTKKQAVAMLKLLSGKTHSVYTGIALWNVKTQELITCCEKTNVKVQKMTNIDIEGYIKKVSPYDKAGAYGVQMKPKIVTAIRGSFSNVVGLPKEALRKLFRKI